MPHQPSAAAGSFAPFINRQSRSARLPWVCSLGILVQVPAARAGCSRQQCKTNQIKCVSGNIYTVFVLAFRRVLSLCHSSPHPDLRATSLSLGSGICSSPPYWHILHICHDSAAVLRAGSVLCRAQCDVTYQAPLPVAKGAGLTGCWNL